MGVGCRSRVIWPSSHPWCDWCEVSSLQSDTIIKMINNPAWRQASVSPAWRREWSPQPPSGWEGHWDSTTVEGEERGENHTDKMWRPAGTTPPPRHHSLWWSQSLRAWQTLFAQLSTNSIRPPPAPHQAPAPRWYKYVIPHIHCTQCFPSILLDLPL